MILSVFVAVFAQNSHYYNYYQQANLGNDYYNYQHTEAPASSKTSHYLDHYGSSKNLYYHNLTGYPVPGVASVTAVQPNEINTDYYDYYYDYESETEPRPNVKQSSDVIISPHPFVVAVQRFMSGLQARQFDLGGLFTGNTIVRVQCTL